MSEGSMNMMKEANAVLGEVHAERQRQYARFGEQNHMPSEYFLILSEEYGEAAREVNDFHWLAKRAVKAGARVHLVEANLNLERIRAELIQTAAVAVGMIESLDRNYLASFRKATQPGTPPGACL